jgi:hypothetical protein
MVRLPIVPKSERPEENVRDALNAIDLLLFYMSDFSVMGLWVSDCGEAVRILQDRFPITGGPHFSEVLIDGTPGIIEVVEALKSSGPDCGISDIVSQVYQG